LHSRWIRALSDVDGHRRCAAIRRSDAMDGLLLDISHPDGFQKGLILCAGGLTIFYAVLRPMRRRKDPLTKPSSLSLAGQREVERQLTELIVELEKMARQMTAQLDTRAAKLELLIQEADVRLAALKCSGESAAPLRPVQPASDHEQTDRRWQWLDSEEMVSRLNRILRGWANYFCLGTVTAAYHKVTAHACHRLRQWLVRKHKVRGSRWSRFSDPYLHATLGLIRLQRPRTRPS